MKKFIRIGVDLAKNYFQIHALTDEDASAATRKLRRAKVLEFFAQIEPCRVGMEACGSAHHWARELGKLGHDVVLMPPAYTKPYVKRGPRMTRPVPGRSARRCRARACGSFRSRARKIRRR